MAMILLIVFGFLRSIGIYLLTANEYIKDENLRKVCRVSLQPIISLARNSFNSNSQIQLLAFQDIRDVLLGAFVYAICGFAISSLFLSIERCIAVYKPKQYERYSDKVILPAVTLATTVSSLI